MIPSYFVLLSIVANVFGYFFYLRSIIRGETKPNLVSWVLWVLAPFVGIYFQLKDGAGWATLPIFMAGFGPLLVIILALFKRNAYWQAGNFDYFCGALSFFALIIYVVTHSLSISIIFAILSDFLAFFPVIKKSWNYPETENYSPYLVGVINGSLSLLVLKQWSFVSASYGIFLVVMNLVQISVIKRKSFKYKVTSQTKI